MNKYISISKAADILGVSQKTLRRWDESGTLKAHKMPSGQRKYIEEELHALMGLTSVDVNQNKNKVFIYGRVSTKKQFESGNLDRQIDRITEYCNNKKYEVVNTYKEVASGINENRPQLLKMLNNLSHADKIIVEYPDRLARFGLNYIKLIAKQNNVEIEFIEDNESKSSNEEMAEDIVSTITCFSAKLYGARGGRKIKKVLNELSKEDVEQLI